MKGTAPSSQHLIPFLARFSQTSPGDLPSWVMVLMSGKDEMIRSPFFWSRSIGDFALCVNGKVYTSCGRPSFQAGVRLMRGGPSEVGKVELGACLGLVL